MKLKVIKTKKEYPAYLNWVDELFDKRFIPIALKEKNWR
jgi:hypothetical protein